MLNIPHMWYSCSWSTCSHNSCGSCLKIFSLGGDFLQPIWWIDPPNVSYPCYSSISTTYCKNITINCLRWYFILSDSLCVVSSLVTCHIVRMRYLTCILFSWCDYVALSYFIFRPSFPSSLLYCMLISNTPFYSLGIFCLSFLFPNWTGSRWHCTQ